MSGFSSCWLVVNPASGGNADGAAKHLEAEFGTHGISVERTFEFPNDALPTAEDLDRAGIDLVAVFAGDGTVNTLITGLAGWGGKVLVLPGGTMNLLACRLHCGYATEQIIPLVAKGGARARRPICIQTQNGTALAGLLVGPGTCWHEVREAMRSGALAEVASGALDALNRTASGPPVRMVGSALARDEGYPLIELTPGEHGIQVSGYYASEPLDYAEQAWATMRRRFREGPHDDLGMVAEVTLESMDHSALPCLFDGEPVECADGTTFVLAPCEVDLLVTSHEF